MSWLLEVNAFGRRPLFFHLVQIAWFLFAIGGVARLGRELGLQRRWAMVAATMFALHPAASEPAALIMARSDVVATACMVWALAMFAWYRRTGRGLALHTVFFVLALASKESAVIVAPLVTVWVVTDRRRVAAIAPAWAAVVAYLLLRRWAIGRLSAIEPTFDVLRIFAGGGHSLAALAHLGPTTELRNLSRAEAAARWMVAAPAWLAFGATLFCGRAPRLLAAWIAGSLAVVLLPKTMWVPNTAEKIALADRWLLPAVAAFALLIAVLLQRFVRGRFARHALIVFAGWTAISIGWAGVVRASYRNDDTMRELDERVYADTPEEFRTLEDRCRSRDRAIVAEISRDPARALALDDARECPPSATSLIHRISALTRLGRWSEAKPLVDQLLARHDFEGRERAPAAYLAGLVALETGDAALAEHRFLRAQAFGETACALFVHSARAAMMLHRPGVGARRLERAYACAGQRDLLVAAAAAFDEAGEPAEAARVRARLAP